ncbi:hypothetical protein ACFLYV_00090 [Chloroflexota bacterium]
MNWFQRHLNITAISIALGILLVATTIYGVVLIRDRNKLNTELTNVNSVLTSTKSLLDSSQTGLASTRTELASTQTELASTQATLASTKGTLTSTQEELSSTKDMLTSTEMKLDSAQSDLAEKESGLISTKQTLTQIQNELIKSQDIIALYQETFGSVYAGEQPPTTGGETIGIPYLINNADATNPSWRQLKTFLLADSTDDIDYDYFSFNCVSFSEQLHNNAEAAGIKSAFVNVEFKGETVGHTLNVFQTEDKGLVYIDNTGGTGYEKLIRQINGNSPLEYDKISYLVKGKDYGVISIIKANSIEYSYYEMYGEFESDWLSMGIVESIEIYW